MVDDCPTCAYHFEREEGFFLGAFVMNSAITLASLMLFLFISFALTLPHPPLLKLAIGAGTFGFLLPILTYPFSKTLWCSVDLIMRRAMGDPWSGGQQTGIQKRR